VEVGRRPLLVKQGPRHWTFCTVECLRGFLVLSELPDRHEDDMIDYEFDMGRIRP
jgi:hypothetical protein